MSERVCVREKEREKERERERKKDRKKERKRDYYFHFPNGLLIVELSVGKM